MEDDRNDTENPMPKWVLPAALGGGGLVVAALYARSAAFRSVVDRARRDPRMKQMLDEALRDGTRIASDRLFPPHAGDVVITKAS